MLARAAQRGRKRSGDLQGSDAPGSLHGFPGSHQTSSQLGGCTSSRSNRDPCKLLKAASHYTDTVTLPTSSVGKGRLLTPGT